MLPCGVGLAMAIVAIRGYWLLRVFWLGFAALSGFAAAGVESGLSVLVFEVWPRKIWSQPWENFWLDPVWTVYPVMGWGSKSDADRSGSNPLPPAPDPGGGQITNPSNSLLQDFPDYCAVE